MNRFFCKDIFKRAEEVFLLFILGIPTHSLLAIVLECPSTNIYLQ